MVHFISRRKAWWTPGNIATQPHHLIWRGGQGTDAVTADAWRDDIKAQSQTGEVLVCVHGFNTSRSGFLAMVKALKAQPALQNYHGAIVGYDWPTGSEDGITGFWNKLFGLRRLYKNDKATANAMDDMLVRDLRFLFEDPDLQVHVLAHSMGCYLTTLAVGHAEQWLGTVKPFDQVAFGAADVDQKLLVKDEWGGKAMNRRCARVTHYHSFEDDILDISGQVMWGGSKRSGKHGLLTDAPDQFVDVSTSQRYEAKFPQHKQDMRLSHNWYQLDSQFLADLVLTLDGKSADAMPTRRVENGKAILKES